jgi:DNA helicase IV
MLYARLDDMRKYASERLEAVLRSPGESAAAQAERDAAFGRCSERLAQLDAADRGLCFGRLDLLDGDTRHIGRIGILPDAADEDDNPGRAPLLIDWRAPAARPFYLATGFSPQGVRLRRHIREQHRQVTEVHDEVLGQDASGEPTTDEPVTNDPVTGEAALLAALNEGRTGQMRDIVATIQAEQDQVIRSGRDGILVVQGGPGTGKTAVALHRAAYLLYTYRENLATRGVLMIGPNATFLRYIDNVLPSLGETSVLLATMGELFPGVTANLAESAETREVKGRLVMADVIAAAIRDREFPPDATVEVEYEQCTVRLDWAACNRVWAMARESPLPHNQARPFVVREISDALAREYARQIGTDVLDGSLLLDESEIEELRQDMLEDGAVRDLLGEVWPDLTPERLLADLFSSAERIGSAVSMLTFGEPPLLTLAEQCLLLRAPNAGWSPSDVPLLDEAAELLGTDDRADRAREAREHREGIDYAQGVLDIAHGSRALELDDGADDGPADGADAEVLSASVMIDAEQLAERHAAPDYLTPAERAAADRSWTFGHVIVDEAQELSEMDWRLLMRRCPARSMTVVGDIAQTSDPAGTTSWSRVLDRYAADRWRLSELSVNYRMPAEIMAVAAGVLAEVVPSFEPPRSVRATGTEVRRRSAAPGKLRECLARAAAEEAASLGEGRLAIIVPTDVLAELGAAVASAVASAMPSSAATVGEDPEHPARVVVLTPGQAKGLEFDSVIVAEPARIIAGSPRGRSDLYVALTRATQRLAIVHAADLPGLLAQLPEQ